MSKLGKFTQQDLDRAKRFAKKAQTPGQPFIVWNTNLGPDQDQWIMGNKRITNPVFICAVDETSWVYKLFENGVVVKYLRFNAITEEEPKRPDSHHYGWQASPKDKSENPKLLDPWKKELDALLLRLGDDSSPDGVVVILQCTTRSVRAEIGALTDHFIETGGKTRFFVRLTTEVDPTNKYVVLPKIEILSPSDDTTDLFFGDDGTVSIASKADDGSESRPNPDDDDDVWN